MDKFEEKLAGWESDFDSAWKNEISIGSQIKQDLLNAVIIGIFFLLSWFFLFAIFLVLSAIGASLLNLKFLFRTIRQGTKSQILLRIIISLVLLPAYVFAIYYTVTNTFLG